MDHAQNHCMIHSRPDGYPVVRQHLIGWIEKGIDRDEARTVLLGLPIVIGGQPRLAPYRVGTPEQEQLGLDHVEPVIPAQMRSEEHTSELQSLMRISYAVFCLKKKTKNMTQHTG